MEVLVTSQFLAAPRIGEHSDAQIAKLREPGVVASV